MPLCLVDIVAEQSQQALSFPGPTIVFRPSTIPLFRGEQLKEDNQTIFKTHLCERCPTKCTTNINQRVEALNRLKHTYKGNNARTLLKKNKTRADI